MGRPKQITNEQIVVTARRCFLERGANVSALEIANELGVSHTTLFNRFGSKEALMLAALGSSENAAWVKALEAGPDQRPIREQLIEHGKVISDYFQALQESMAVLQAAGLKSGNPCINSNPDSPPAQAFRAFTAWLKKAQDQGRLAPCNVETLASTILGALHNWAFTQDVCGHTSPSASENAQVEHFIELLWNGIGPEQL
jgi:AcrR family transcriptional regulator